MENNLLTHLLSVSAGGSTAAWSSVWIQRKLCRTSQPCISHSYQTPLKVTRCEPGLALPRLFSAFHCQPCDTVPLSLSAQVALIRCRCLKLVFSAVHCASARLAALSQSNSAWCLFRLHSTEPELPCSSACPAVGQPHGQIYAH